MKGMFGDLSRMTSEVQEVEDGGTGGEQERMTSPSSVGFRQHMSVDWPCRSGSNVFLKIIYLCT